MTKKERFARVLHYFTRIMPRVETESSYRTPYELLVAVILSAQCTDKRVNMTTPEFFKVFPTPQKLAAAAPEQVYPLIKSISYPNSKAKHLVGMAKMLVNDFGGVMPDKVETLMRLPGVGRKTANVIASVVYDLPALAGDTHLFRVSARLGLTPGAKKPIKTKKKLLKNIP